MVGVDWYPSNDFPNITFSYTTKDVDEVDSISTQLSDKTDKSFNASLSKQYNIAGFNANSMISFGKGEVISTPDTTAGSDASNFFINTSVRFPFIPLKVFAQFSNNENSIPKTSETKNNTIKLNGTYELISSDDMALSAYTQYVNSITKITSLNTIATTDFTQNSVEFGANLSYNLTSTISMSSFLSFRTLGISSEVIDPITGNNNDDYSNSYLNLGASLTF
jgi:hypothetical protein